MGQGVVLGPFTGQQGQVGAIHAAALVQVAQTVGPGGQRQGPGRDIAEAVFHPDLIDIAGAGLQAGVGVRGCALPVAGGAAGITAGFGEGIENRTIDIAAGGGGHGDGGFALGGRRLGEGGRIGCRGGVVAQIVTVIDIEVFDLAVGNSNGWRRC